MITTDMIDSIRNTITLLDSMITSGKSHSDRSEIAIDRAYEHLDELREAIQNKKSKIENEFWILVCHQPQDMAPSSIVDISNIIYFDLYDAKKEVERLNKDFSASSWEPYWTVKKMQINFGDI
jgi:hypothetical protein